MSRKHLPSYHPFSKCILFQPRIALAQDSELRHVVIKVLLSDSEEFRVLNSLHQDKDLIQEFQGVIPVLDMLPFGVFHFAVLPRYVGRRYISFTLLKFQ